MKHRRLQIPVLVLTALILAVPSFPVTGHEIEPAPAWTDLLRTWLLGPSPANAATESAGQHRNLPVIPGDDPAPGGPEEATASTAGPDEPGSGESGHQIDPDG